MVNPLPSSSPPSDGTAAYWDLVSQIVSNGIRMTSPCDNQNNSFKSFPYLHRATKEVLGSTAHLHLVHKKKIAADIPSLSRFTLLSGPPGSEIYRENLAASLAKEFDAPLFLFDPILPSDDATRPVTDRSPPHPFLQMVRQIVDPSSPSRTASPPDPCAQLVLDIVALWVRIVPFVHDNGPLVVFLSDVLVSNIEKYIATSEKLSSRLKDTLDLIPAGVLVIASRAAAVEREEEPQPEYEQSNHPIMKLEEIINFKITREETRKVSTRQLSDLFPNEVIIGMPEDKDLVASWNDMMAEHAIMLQSSRNNARIQSALRRIGWSCGDIGAICIEDRMLSDGYVSRMLGYAIMHHLQSKKGEALSEHVLSSDSIKHAFRLLEDITIVEKRLKKSVVTENEYERKLLADVVPPDELRVTFDDVGALDNVKDVVRETVMLPLQRPELFSRGQLTKPCKGILLFGPPGTGKTMLAKAIATEAGANFINVTTSNITSKWYGEEEKYARAVFTLASKLAPCVVFVDEVDSMLGSRESCGDEHEASRRLKNVFMTNWDGLRTKDKERVVILAATNRPFDLDEAVVRRFPKRLMVGLPDSANREKILRVILSKEDLAPDVDLVAIANMTEGYSGSDLKHLCVDAAHRPIREILAKEKTGSTSSASHSVTEVRPLEMDDFRYAHGRLGASTSSTSAAMSRLVEWNNIYGEGGSRKKPVLGYYL